MPELLKASVAVRRDVIDIEQRFMEQLAQPGATLTGEQRVAIARAARGEASANVLHRFARHLYTVPATVSEQDVRAAADSAGEPKAVETIGIVARLAAVDRVHTVLDVELEPLPDPRPGDPSGVVSDGLRRSRCHLPMPPGPIPFALDLLPDEGRKWQEMFGPLYMTEEEMGDPHFHRDPGLDTPQLETVAARISALNECFY